MHRARAASYEPASRCPDTPDQIADLVEQLGIQRLDAIRVLAHLLLEESEKGEHSYVSGKNFVIVAIGSHSVKG